jgi:hypothetical protein
MLLVVLAGLLLAPVAGAVVLIFSMKQTVGPPTRSAEPVQNLDKKIDRFCGSCHKVPPPDTFPRSAWKMEVEQGYGFSDRFKPMKNLPPVEAVIKWYEERAPLELPPADIHYADQPFPVTYECVHLAGLSEYQPPVISNVNLVHLFDEKRWDLLACDMRHGLVMVYQPYVPKPSWRVLAKLNNPAHAEVVDLNGDGIKDIIVADLGSFPPTDRRCGRVVWLRGNPDRQTFTPITLLDQVGRVADVQAANFRSPDKKDLIVAAFGWQEVGEILFLENHTTDWDHPKFEKRVLDERHGAIHVPVADLNGDDKPDFVALISQEHETIVAFINKGDGTFDKKTLYEAPHPAYGSSGIQLVDLNGDGKLDILYTNGDVLDEPYLLKPYHGIQWLENKGNLEFEHHWIAPMYGVHRAYAADLRGEGKMDIVAVSFLPIEGFPQRVEKNVDSVVILEQTSPGVFARHRLESQTCYHVSCIAGDFYGTGRNDLLIGNFASPQDKHSSPITIFKSRGSQK